VHSALQGRRWPSPVFRIFLNQFAEQGNRPAKKAVGTAAIRGFLSGFSAGSECEGRRSFLHGRVIGGLTGMRAAGAAFLGAGAEGIVDDALDGAGAAAAFSATAEAAVNLLGIPRQVRGCTHGTPDIVVAQDVAGTDDHETAKTLRDATSWILKPAPRCKRKSRNFKQFQTDACQRLE
jgi:hypothetical protein